MLVNKEPSSDRGEFGSLDNLPQDVVKLLYNRKLKIATAESCTGGLISALITGVPGSSEVFDLGVCTYSNNMKLALLGINPNDLAHHGAVSEVVAKQMADGVRRISNADIGISTTGIAGPGGGTVTKPVGTVYVGVATGTEVKAILLTLKGERDIIRMQSALSALELVKNILNDINEKKENDYGI